MINKRYLGSHNESHTRLYRCWNDMHTRSKTRKGCAVDPVWSTFEIFKEWALKSGYADNLCLCREGDTGDYTPSNVRWDTKANNTKEAHQKAYIIVWPCGCEQRILNLSKWCRLYGVRQSGMSKVANGDRKTHLGFKCFKG